MMNGDTELKPLITIATKWLVENPGKTPEFSRGQGMVFNDNDDADEIEEIIVKAANDRGLFVAPQNIWNIVAIAMLESGRLEQEST